MSKKHLDINEENQFSLCTGDLMAALLFVFILLLTGTMLKLEEEFDVKKKIAVNYKALQVDLYKDLSSEFNKDLMVWGAEIDSTLTVRFKEPDVLFDPGSSELKQSFKDILDDFFPRYINVIYAPKYLEHIEEVRIEGHTSIEGLSGMDENKAYYYNMRLSQNRTRSVLMYVLSSLKEEKYLWTKERATANGLSSVKPIADNNTLEGRKINRRVEFRIMTDAEAQMRKMLKYAEE